MSGLDVGQLKRLIVRPALQSLGLWSAAAENLLTGTALVESGAAYVRQIGGPALGLWQMEPETHDDCWQNFLWFPKQSRLATILLSMRASDPAPAEQLVTNAKYACAMARIRFYRAPAPLPAASDAEALSQYHKDFYNTSAGKADAQRNVPLFQQAIEA